jgi:hypothetical protein
VIRERWSAQKAFDGLQDELGGTGS